MAATDDTRNDALWLGSQSKEFQGRWLSQFSDKQQQGVIDNAKAQGHSLLVDKPVPIDSAAKAAWENPKPFDPKDVHDPLSIPSTIQSMKLQIRQGTLNAQQAEDTVKSHNNAFWGGTADVNSIMSQINSPQSPEDYYWGSPLADPKQLNPATADFSKGTPFGFSQDAAGKLQSITLNSQGKQNVYDASSVLSGGWKYNPSNPAPPIIAPIRTYGLYEHGGVVPGKIGKPVVVIAHGGEVIGQPEVAIKLAKKLLHERAESAKKSKPSAGGLIGAGERMAKGVKKLSKGETRMIPPHRVRRGSGVTRRSDR